MNLGLLTGAPGTAMLAPPLLLSGSSPPPPPSPDAQLHALRRTISTLIERYASLARTAVGLAGASWFVNGVNSAAVASASSSAATSARTPAGSAKKRDAPAASTRRRSENKRPARERPAAPPAFDIFDQDDFRFS